MEHFQALEKDAKEKEHLECELLWSMVYIGYLNFFFCDFSRFLITFFFQGSFRGNKNRRVEFEE